MTAARKKATRAMPSMRTTWSMWAMPLLMAVLTATGLVTALVSNTWGDWWAWVGLGTPVAVMAWHALPRKPSPSGTSMASPSFCETASTPLALPPQITDQITDPPNGPPR